jgi:predicted transcriptional regulator of viral defense system
MNLLEAYQQLKILEPTFSTKEAGEVLGVSPNYTAAILSRLAKKETVVRLARGKWAYSRSADPLLFPSILVHPMMAYVSLYSALYYHGMIEQIPSTVFAVTNGKTNVFATPLGKISLHSINPALFTDYDYYGKNDIPMATPEKALFDTLYFMPAKSNLFKQLTEVELPDTFEFAQLDNWIEKVNNICRQQLIRKQVASLQKQ